jgi:hypothetical protein
MKDLCPWFDAAADVHGTPSISQLNELYPTVLPLLPAAVTPKGRTRNVNQLTWVRVITLIRQEELEAKEKDL